MELVAFGLKRTLIYIIGKQDTTVSSQILVSNCSLSTKQALTEKFQLLPKDGYKKHKKLTSLCCNKSSA